jgi:hypothetical protein
MKRNLHNVKRMTSHPVHQYCKYFVCHPRVWSDFWRIRLIKTLQFLTAHLLCLDLTGAQDGSVRMFEWTRPQQLVCFRQAGNARVTRLYFNSQGNKVCSWELVLNASKKTESWVCNIY